MVLFKSNILKCLLKLCAYIMSRLFMKAIDGVKITYNGKKMQ